MYHPTLGRWIQRDPLGYVDGVNLYAYCGGGPLGATDPMGQCKDSPQKLVDDIANGKVGPREAKERFEDLPPEQQEEFKRKFREAVREGKIDFGGGGGGGGRGRGSRNVGGGSGKWLYDWARDLGLSGLAEDGEWGRDGFGKSTIGAGPIGRPSDFPHLPPAYDPGKWKFRPNQNYNPNDPLQRPGSFEDPQGNKVQWDPDLKGKHGYRPHWDVDTPKGKRIRLKPDGTPLEDASKAVITGGAVGAAAKIAWEGIKAIGTAAGGALESIRIPVPMFIIMPDLYYPQPKHHGDKQEYREI